MDGLSFNPFDTAVLMILTISGIMALSKGFTTEFLSLVAWAGAVFITLQGHPFLAPYAYKLISPEFMADIILYAFLGIFSLMALKYLATAIGDRIKKSHIGALDRALGTLFGLVRGMLAVSFLYLLATIFISERHYPGWFKEAKARPLVEYGASMLNSMNPYKDSIDFEERRKDIEALQRLKKMMPSFPSTGPSSGKEDEESKKQMDELFEKLSKT